MRCPFWRLPCTAHRFRPAQLLEHNGALSGVYGFLLLESALCTTVHKYFVVLYNERLL